MILAIIGQCSHSFFYLRVFIPPMNEICGYEAKICGYKVGKLNKTKKTC